ncbi:hypothetical protein ERJ75_000365000 [Trypanosoma vivax]|nr:hypothetical protein ERJ75_000365000 [Trypanosoma vivax]
MLTSPFQTIEDAGWNIFLCASRVFVEKHGQGSFSFACRPRADVVVVHADAFLRLENDELSFFENRQAKFMDLQNVMVSFELPKYADFIRVFEATKECFQNERRASEKGRSALDQQCEAAPLQIDDERQSMKAHFATSAGENSGLKQRICPPREQNQQMLMGIRSLQCASGVLVA